MTCKKLFTVCFLFLAVAISSGAAARGFYRNYGFYGSGRQSVEIYIGGGGSSIYLGSGSGDLYLGNGFTGGGIQYYDYYDGYGGGGYYNDYPPSSNGWYRPPQRCWSYDCGYGYYRRSTPNYGNDCQYYGGCGWTAPRRNWDYRRHYHDHHSWWHEHRR